MKILFCDANREETRRFADWKETHKEFEIDIIPGPVTESGSFDYDVISTFITSEFTEAVIGKFPALKMIATRSTGFDHIDMAACKKRGIIVANVPDYGDKTVAEFTILLVLMLERQIRRIMGRVAADGVSDPLYARGRDLNGKTVGVVGAGKIGTNVGLLAAAFGANVVYFNRSSREALEGVGAKKAELYELASESDVVTVHLPLNSDTEHMIGSEFIKAMKKGAMIVNTSRGAIIDTDALIYGLENGIVGGAALDVIEGEKWQGKEMDAIRQKKDYDTLKQALEQSVLRRFDNVILTPHIAYDTEEAEDRIITETLENLDNFLRAKEVRNVC